MDPFEARGKHGPHAKATVPSTEHGTDAKTNTEKGKQKPEKFRNAPPNNSDAQMQ
jgi:hypothetical protein